MLRACRQALACGLVVLTSGLQAAPPPLPIPETLTQARNLIAQNQPSEAVALLEAQLHRAEGHKEFKETLRSAYLAELRLLGSQKADPRLLEAIRTKLALVGGGPGDTLPLPAIPPAGSPAPAWPTSPSAASAAATPPAISPAPAWPTSPSSAIPPALTSQQAAATAVKSLAGLEELKQATALFNEAKTRDPARFADAARAFQAAARENAPLRKDHLAAWAYCRIRAAADRLNKSSDTQVAAEVAAEIEDAVKLVPDHEPLRSVAQEIATQARQRAGLPAVRSAPEAAPAVRSAPESVLAEVLETENFRIHHGGAKALADLLARTAETRRQDILAAWSGPAGGVWKPKCDIILHASADDFARATRMPAGSHGRAEVKLKDGQALARRIDLRADDSRLLEDALPRELTHIILADLFTDQAPPKWAELGMCIHAASEIERHRYSRTLARCARSRELPALADVLKARDVPSEGVTGFCVESVSLVEHLVSLKGEKAFTSFLRDAQRYGVEAALKRQYGFADLRAFEESWRHAALGY